MRQIECIKDCFFRKFADFQSRSSRVEYWSFFAFSLLSITLAALIDIIIIDMPLFLFAVALVFLIPGSAVAVRRLHDTGRSGKLLLASLSPLILIPVIFIITKAAGIRSLPDAPFLAILFWLALAAGMIAPLVFMALPSEAGSNRFGEYEAPVKSGDSGIKKDSSEVLRAFPNRYGFTSEKEDKKISLTTKGYGAIGGGAVILVLMAFFTSQMFSSPQNSGSAQNRSASVGSLPSSISGRVTLVCVEQHTRPVFDNPVRVRCDSLAAVTRTVEWSISLQRQRGVPPQLQRVCGEQLDQLIRNIENRRGHVSPERMTSFIVEFAAGAVMPACEQGINFNRS